MNVEHVSWFGHNPGLDLTNQLMTQATNKYSYVKDAMPKYEKFAFKEAINVDFIGVNIWYDSYCVDQNPETNIKETSVMVTTDIDDGFIYDTKEAGFVILANYVDGLNYYVRENLGRLTHASWGHNMDLSWANLHDAYFRDERILLSGYLNNNLTDFWSVIKSKLQECTALVCDMDDYNPEDEITTELGTTYFSGEKGRVQKADISPDGTIKFNLLYGPVGTKVKIPNGFNVYGYFSIQTTIDDFDTIDIQFRFNETCPGNYNLRVREKVYNDTGVLQWTGGFESFTFTLGSRTYSFNHKMAEGYMHAGWCITLEVEYTGAEIDDIYIPPDPADPSWSCLVPIIYTVL
jgi:hypothetical protein